jgi:hypothetical protein
MQIATQSPRTSGYLSCLSAATRATAAVLLLAGSGAHAHDFCVSTATGLQNALTDASDGGMYAGENNFVRIVTGTYLTGAATGNAPFHYSSTNASGQLFVTGGYSVGCPFLHSRDPSATVLDGNHATAVLTITNKQSVEVTSLTLRNGENTSGASAAGLALNVNGGGYALVQGTIIRDNHTPTTAGGLHVQVQGTGYALIYSNLLWHNSADQHFGAADILDNGTVGDIAHNTFVHNTTSASGMSGGVYYGGSASNMFINDNIFWGNTNAGLQLGTTFVTLQFNDYGMLAGLAPGSSTGNMQVDPQFVDEAGGDFHLSTGSPLLGAVPSHTSLTDLQGLTFPPNGKGDMGAYAQTIFTDGVDP